jgi:PEP-CTERM motif
MDFASFVSSAPPFFLFGCQSSVAAFHRMACAPAVQNRWLPGTCQGGFKWTTRTACALMLLSAFADGVSADPIWLHSARSIEGAESIIDTFGVNARDRFAQQSLDAGVFQASQVATARINGAFLSAAASQHTTLDRNSDHFFGSGSVSVSGSVDQVRVVESSFAICELSVEFILRDAMSYQFSGTLNASQGAAVFTYLDTESGAMWYDVSPLVGTVHVEHSGMLVPGFYSFVTQTITSPLLGPTVSGDGAFDVDFLLSEVTPTPEPASLLLVSTGLIGAVLHCGRRRSRTRSRNDRVALGELSIESTGSLRDGDR